MSYNSRLEWKLGQPKQKWTLREALVQLAPPEFQDDFRRLDEQYRNHPQVWFIGASSQRDPEESRYYELNEALTGKLLQGLRSGAWAAEAIDPVHGTQAIDRDAWKILKPDFDESSATGADKTLVEIRVWPIRPIRASALDEAKCRKWIQRLADEGYLPRSKDALFAEASRKFPKLSRRGFDRCWAAGAPESWSAAGRRRRSDAKQRR